LVHGERGALRKYKERERKSIFASQKRLGRTRWFSGTSKGSNWLRELEIVTNVMPKIVQRGISIVKEFGVDGKEFAA
jgi:hypothetical protein